MIAEATLKELYTVFDLLLQDFQKLVPEPPETVPRGDDCANAVLVSTNSLKECGSRWLTVAQRLISEDPLALLPFVQHVESRICYELARQDVDTLEDRVRATLAVAQLLRPNSASPRAQRLFVNVARSFVCGHHDEWVVMCRAMVEAELKQALAIPDENCVDLIGIIDRAHREFELDFGWKDAAHKIRMIGNDVLHKGVTVDDWDARSLQLLLSNTLMVLRVLDPHLTKAA